MKLTIVNLSGVLFAINEDGSFVGRIVNNIFGCCCNNPENPENSYDFYRMFEGHGCIFQQEDNPPNPFFIRNWSEVFSNWDYLPPGTKNVFLDADFNSEKDFEYRQKVA